MAMKVKGFTIEEKAEQLKKCCETIIEHAEEITKGIDYNVESKITINITCHQTPTIKFEQEFIPKKVIDFLFEK